jgi:RNase H-like domain found in reverse transcriptase
MFTLTLILLQFDYEKETVIETDSSEWSIGGVLIQVDDTGILKPYTFFSKKNALAECNYEIYDKEMLAIIYCLEEWDAEFRSVKEFQIRTNYKNLEYFMIAR